MKGLIFTYLLTYGGAAVSLYNPFVGLLVYVAFSILKPESLWFWMAGDMPSNSSRIVAIALLVGWGLKGTGNWGLGKAWKVVLALGGYTIWCVLSTTQAYHDEYGWGYVEELLKIVLPFLVGITTIDSPRKLRQLAWVIILSQGYVALELNLSYLLDGFNRVTEAGFGGMDNNSVGVAMNTGIGLAGFMALSAPRWWMKALAIAAAGAMAHVVLLSFSRGGMLGLITTGVIAFLLLKKNPWHYLLFLLAVLVLLYFSGPEVQKRFFSTFVSSEERDASAETRIKLWTDCIDVMVKNPVFGVGPRHFGVVAPQYGWPYGKEGHTLWLQAGAELGAPGMVLLASFYFLTAWPLWRMIRDREHPAHPELAALARMVIASVVGFAVSAQFVSLVGLELPYYVALVGAGVLKLASNPEAWSEEDRETESPAEAPGEVEASYPVA